MTDLWIEAHRPQTVEDYVFKNPGQKETVLHWIENGPPHCLFEGKAGTGKTSLAYLILKMRDVSPGDIMFINASRERQPEDLQDKIINFASTWPLGDFKYIILDECLDENEEIQMADDTFMRLGDMIRNQQYDIKSLNMITQEIENDYAVVHSSKEDDIYEVVLEDGRTIKTTLNHPFLVENNGDIIEKKLQDLSVGDRIITII